MFEEYGIMVTVLYLTYSVSALNVLRLYSTMYIVSDSDALVQIPATKVFYNRFYSVLEWAIVALPTMFYTYSNNIENVLGLTCIVAITLNFADSMLDNLVVIGHIMTLMCYIHTNYILCAVFLS